ncbi:MAG: L,D-transpeptidase family protein [Gammaproteobacteria bacterium]
MSLLALQATAATYSLPTDADVVGSLQMTTLRSGVSLSTVVENYDIGYYELLEANPQMNPLHPYVGQRVIIPTQYVLPQAPRQGIVINLAELRLYYYPPGQNVVITEPIGIGRMGWNTPTGTFKIIEKIPNPTWHVPASIAADQASQGVILPKTIPPGPDNPLGAYAMRLSLPDYLIHGTNKPAGVGRRVSSGCIRMYPEDIASLFQMVAVGTPVTIVNQPFKAGWLNGQLYLEAVQPLSEQRSQMGSNLLQLMAQAVDNATAGTNAVINWNKAEMIANQQSSIPQVIGKAG